MIEAFWCTMKHKCLSLNTLDSVTGVARLLSTFVAAHSGEIPHSAFRGQTPGEMCFGAGERVPEKLDLRRQDTRAARLAQNREVCGLMCPGKQDANAYEELRAAA